MGNMKSRYHSPITGAGAERRTAAGKAPGGIAPSWPARGRMPAVGKYRRPAKPRNPDCTTDSTPHHKLVQDWYAQRLTVEDADRFVRTRFPGDALAMRALENYRKFIEALPERMRPATVEKREVEAQSAAFPLTKRDMVRNVKAGDGLAALED